MVKQSASRPISDVDGVRGRRRRLLRPFFSTSSSSSVFGSVYSFSSGLVGVNSSTRERSVEEASVAELVLPLSRFFSTVYVTDALLQPPKIVSRRVQPLEGCEPGILVSGTDCHRFMDDHYPLHSAFSLLDQVIDEYQKSFGETWKSTSLGHTWAMLLPNSRFATLFSHVELVVKTLLDPAEADKLLKIQRELDETKIILHKTIDSVLARGEKLDSLVEKSSDLSMASQKRKDHMSELESAL
ncbi:hypothetical protein F2Q69_00001051 [Brassica cretica]|uniref:V-SNARE coiled-coil homology domain-containing protein n=1 Tax=Brassica cretica TaxID=69181 RepID=A0A8S9P1E7_BRACR|nr:hypothetical protein F2Q69_00001051 [Brassica cretica]